MHSTKSIAVKLTRELSLKRFLSSQELIERDKRYGGRHFEPLPVVLAKGEDVHLWDVEGKRYLDFLAGFATVNQGHCHPRLVKVLREQAVILSHTSRAFYSEPHGELGEYLTKLFGWDRFLPMNTGTNETRREIRIVRIVIRKKVASIVSLVAGVEAGDVAIKVARRWGYRAKKIPDQQATVVFAEGNFWGRSIAALSASTDLKCYADFGPYVPRFDKVPYDDLEALEQKFKKDPTVCAFMVEPIQGERGVVVPKEGYLKGVRDLCDKYDVLWIADEVQTGLGRTGKRLAVDYENQRPDILVLGKALAGGMYPVSGILADDEIMLCLDVGSHGSTFGGNPLGNKVALEAVKIVEEENLAENACELGNVLREGLEKFPKEIFTEIRGRGLLLGAVLNKDFADGWDICLKLKEAGLLSRPAHGQILRFSPPLTIKREQIEEGLYILATVLNSHK